MRLGFFYRDYLGPGAYPRDARLLAQALAPHVDHVIIYCYADTRADEGSSTADGITTRRYYVPRRLKFVNFFYVPPELRHVLEAKADDLDVLTLIGAFVPANYPIARIAVRTGLPYAVSPGEPINAYALTARGVKWARKQLYARIFERFILEHAAAIQLCSGAHTAHLLGLGFDVDPSRAFVGREAIDWQTIRSEDPDFDRGDRSENPEDLVFGFLGRIRPFHKGLDILLHAWGLYRKLGGTGRLDIVGPGTQRDLRELERLASRLGLVDVAFLGPKYGHDKYAFLRSISALVHPSRHDGITRVIREGLACECTLITTYHTHVYELLEKHDAGFAVATDPLALALSMKRFADAGAPERLRLRRGAADVQRELNWDNGAAQFLAGIRARIPARGRNTSTSAVGT